MISDKKTQASLEALKLKAGNPKNIKNSEVTSEEATTVVEKIKNKVNTERIDIDSTQMLYFPTELKSANEQENFPFMHFKIKQNIGPNAVNIFLYQPPGISVSDGANYVNFNLGELTGITSFAMDVAKGNRNVTSSDILAGALIAKNKLGGAESSFRLRNKAALKAGVATNPHTRQVFEGVNIRNFSFSFKLVAQSAEESKMATDIEKTFRKFLYPKKAGGIALTYPPLFYIKFYSEGGKENHYMPKIKPCYLTGLESAFNETANAMHAGTGAPIEVNLTVSFQEERALIRDDLYENDSTFIEQPSEYFDKSSASFLETIDD